MTEAHTAESDAPEHNKETTLNAHDCEFPGDPGFYVGDDPDPGNAARTARMLRLPAADERVSHLHMQAVAALIEQWEEDDADSDDYTRQQAAEDLRRMIASACTCRALPHDQSCPRRTPLLPDEDGDR